MSANLNDYDPLSYTVELVHVDRERESLRLNGRKTLVFLDLRQGRAYADLARRVLNLKFWQLTALDGAKSDAARANYQLRITLDVASIPGWEDRPVEVRYWSPEPDQPDEPVRRRR